MGQDNLFTVTDSFMMEGRGLALDTSIGTQGPAPFSVGDPLVLRTPSARRYHAEIAAVEYVRHSPHVEPMITYGVILNTPDLKPEDLPAGTEADHRPWDAPRFNPGFRFAKEDIFQQTVSLLWMLYLSRFGLGTAIVFTTLWGLMFTLRHAFRAPRTVEWFLALMVGAAAIPVLAFRLTGWYAVLALCSILLGTAAILIYSEFRKPGYHGVGWRRINPNLREWWETTIGGEKVSQSTLVEK